MHHTMIYCGPLGHLRDKTALVRPGYAPDQMLAQFDDHTATRSGKPFAEVAHTTVLEHEPHARFPTEHRQLKNEPPDDLLGYGWHVFPADHFKGSAVMRTIYKYPLGLVNSQIVTLPSNAKALSVQLQGEQLCLWAEVEPSWKMGKEVVISVVGTGHEIPPGAVNYLGTVQQGGFVWHVYASTGLGPA